MNAKQLRTLAAVLAAAAALAACGGGGDGDDGGSGGGGSASGAAGDLPGSARQSVNGLVAFVTGLIANGTNDTSEPVAAGNAPLPTDDNIEAVN
ncbi:MAG TPA: hypothetical protein VEA35_05450 [Ramlibacter sp.]|nr:hypothetical protein [Ramlibacter sp.]